jgi:hypothetical protein
MAGADLPALPGAGSGDGATVGRDLADGQCLAAMLEAVSGWGMLIHGVRFWAGAVKGASSRRAGREFIPANGGKVLGCTLQEDAHDS